MDSSENRFSLVRWVPEEFECYIRAPCIPNDIHYHDSKNTIMITNIIRFSFRKILRFIVFGTIGEYCQTVSVGQGILESREMPDIKTDAVYPFQFYCSSGRSPACEIIFWFMLVHDHAETRDSIQTKNVFYDIDLRYCIVPKYWDGSGSQPHSKPELWCLHLVSCKNICSRIQSV